MPKLKTFIAESGFYELAVAAPSMKAALAAWGFAHNAFHQGFAKATADPKIARTAEAQPGVVLRRPIGTKGDFKAAPDTPRPPKGKKRHKEKKPDAKKIRAAQTALHKAEAEYRKRFGGLNKALATLQARISAEDDKWRARREKLEAALDRARRPH